VIEKHVLILKILKSFFRFAVLGDTVFKYQDYRSSLLALRQCLLFISHFSSKLYSTHKPLDIKPTCGNRTGGKNVVFSLKTSNYYMLYTLHISSKVTGNFFRSNTKQIFLTQLKERCFSPHLIVCVESFRMAFISYAQAWSSPSPSVAVGVQSGNGKRQAITRASSGNSFSSFLPNTSICRQQSTLY